MVKAWLKYEKAYMHQHKRHVRKYQIPFFCYSQFNIRFLWVNRKKILIGFVEDKEVLSQSPKGRKKDNVWILEISPFEDIPLDAIKFNFRN